MKFFNFPNWAYYRLVRMVNLFGVVVQKLWLNLASIKKARGPDEKKKPRYVTVNREI